MGDGNIVINYSANEPASGCQKYTLDMVDISGSVSLLRFKVADKFGLRPDQLDLVYAGRSLQDDNSLEWYGVQSGATVLVLKKLTKDAFSCSKPDDHKIEEALKISRRRGFQRALESVLIKSTTFNSIVGNNASLCSDPVALALLQDSNLLMMCMKDGASRTRTLEAHPGVGDAVVRLMNLVSAEIKQPNNVATRQQYNLDRMDDEDEEADEQDSVLGNQGSLPLPPLPHGSAITADFFRQAMAIIAGNTGQARGPAPTYEVQLQQLRDMGITDEVLARRALQEANGDVQHALTLIFGDDL